jgi:hypothetical protein
LSELEGMIPWERDVYISLLVKYLKDEKEKARRDSMGKSMPKI